MTTGAKGCEVETGTWRTVYSVKPGSSCTAPQPKDSEVTGNRSYMAPACPTACACESMPPTPPSCGGGFKQVCTDGVAMACNLTISSTTAYTGECEIQVRDAQGRTSSCKLDLSATHVR